MRCPTGCRKRHESQGASKRAAAYRQTEKGRKKKAEINRRRSLKSAHEKIRQKNDDAISNQRVFGLLSYYQWIILLVDGILMNASQLKDLLMKIRTKVRQRGRDCCDDTHYIRDD